MDELQMPIGTKIKFSEGFGNILVTTKAFNAGDVLFRETPVLTYNPKDLIFANLSILICAIKNRENVFGIVHHPRASEWCMHMLAFSLAEIGVKESIMNSFYRPSRLDVFVPDYGLSERNDDTDPAETKTARTDTVEDQATISLLADSIACARWLQALATSYMALAAVPELAEVLPWPAETLADAALVFVFSAHRFRGVPPRTSTNIPSNMHHAGVTV